MTFSQRNPQLEPSNFCYTILQDHGPYGGGWGPAMIILHPALVSPGPVFYTGSDPETLASFEEIADDLARLTGKATRVCRFTNREDIYIVGE